jgi:hypothetical protein
VQHTSPSSLSTTRQQTQRLLHTTDRQRTHYGLTDSALFQYKWWTAHQMRCVQRDAEECGTSIIFVRIDAGGLELCLSAEMPVLGSMLAQLPAVQQVDAPKSKALSEEEVWN